MGCLDGGEADGGAHRNDTRRQDNGFIVVRARGHAHDDGLTLQSFLGRFGGGFAYMDRWDLFWIAWGCLLGPCIFTCVVMVCFYASIYARHLDALD